MRQTPPDRHGLRLPALIVVLCRGGLRIQEALSLIESDLDPRRGSILIRRGKGNRRREGRMDGWAWSDHLAPWLVARAELPGGALFCVIDGPTRGRPWSATAARGELRRCGRRSAPVRAPPTPPRTHCRARPRAGAAAGHPAAARTFVRLHDQRVSAGDRRRGDHQNDPRAASADDGPQRRPRTLRRAPSDDRVGGVPRGSSPAGARSRAAPPPDCISEPAAAGAAAAAQTRQHRQPQGRRLRARERQSGCLLADRRAARCSQ